jgi:hypothetical protein
MKTKALKLADEVLAKEYAPRLEIAKELRRLHLENEQLKAREWVGLTPEERQECIAWATDLDSTEYSKYLAKMIEHKLKEKNGG